MAANAYRGALVKKDYRLEIFFCLERSSLHPGSDHLVGDSYLDNPWLIFFVTSLIVIVSKAAQKVDSKKMQNVASTEV